MLTRKRVEEATRQGAPIDWLHLEWGATLMLRRFLRVMTMASLARREPLPAAWAGLVDEYARAPRAAVQYAGTRQD